MVNQKKLVLKAITKGNALADTKWQLLVENLMLSGHFEVNFWSHEGSENCKLEKVSPEGNYIGEILS